MNNRKKYRGLWTALITPFKDGDGISNEVDYEALDRILQMQIDAKVTGILLLGTTAENPTLTDKESLNIVNFAVKKLNGILQDKLSGDIDKRKFSKIKIMVNIGTYSTKASIENVKIYNNINGIDAYLIVNPYYNKPTQTGLFKHFTSIAKETKRNIILYNIKGRTGVNLETNTLLDIISENKNIIGVKEASGDMLQMKEVINATGDDFIVFSGDDSLTYELVSNGGDGVISVASNCIPNKMQEFVSKCFDLNSKAKELNDYYLDFFDKLFIQTNPLPAKTYLANKGIILENFRLPICRMDDNEKGDFLNVCKKFNF